ncbi:P-loop containing nucleoside triphosphate hydrolase protein [Ophiobolus disseminans]|uniref:P-loop containing nucleoside triphosphate hydrolase protein n=1 Tax=Ophiobolus disseminans TaxID=1469910 RepID=A0A6A7A1W1_9PLEO|nr:P-loop containing nucleoside triphosphate hydrolase protein [Ophiobolus disseminans]
MSWLSYRCDRPWLRCGLTHHIPSFGIDVGLLVPGYLVIYGLFQFFSTIHRFGNSYFVWFFSSEIMIEEKEYLFDQVLAWIAKQPNTKVSRSLKAVTRYNGGEPEEENNDCVNENGTFNYEKWASSIPLSYEPNFGTNEFRYKDRYVSLTRQKLEKADRYEFKEFLMIRCNDRSTEPIKDLLAHIKNWMLSKETNFTSVYRPGGADGWTRECCRASRPIDTVALDDAQKANIVEDMNEYLHPDTARWYTARGIPHRRGYLFHGPPGTGKTSLSFSLAGNFGLKAYVISLSEADINKKSKSNSAISLAGLLYLIDGAASTEGRVLIMSTNYPEMLDAALVCPGHIDMQIHFALATRGQIRDIFKRMYTAQESDTKAGAIRSIFTKKLKAACDDLDPEKLSELAAEFTEQMPEDTLSPAEIQGYLLIKKRDPIAAVKEAGTWRDATIAVKKKGKVFTTV